MKKMKFLKMLKKIKRQKLAIMFLFAFSQLFCEESDKLISYHPYFCPTCEKSDFKEGLVQNSQIMPGFNASGRYDLPFFVSGTFLYFQPIEKGTLFALSNNDINLESQRTFDIDIRYKAGFRL